jgi:hypothetical protein
MDVKPPLHPVNQGMMTRSHALRESSRFPRSSVDLTECSNRELFLPA